MTTTEAVGSLVGTDLGLTALSGIPTTDEPQKSKDFTSDQEVRWCPGCGDYAILNSVRNFLPELGCGGRTWCSSAGSAARAASRTT